jgi:S-adenosylmethionine-diacylgycerolhomoserine-N-methlytransferase
MKLLADLPTIWHMIFPPARRGDQEQRLDAFYKGQAKNYDDFRKRLLHGREELMAAVEVPEGGVWIDMGAGTGSNAELLGERLPRLRRALMVDLCPSLQDVARQRVKDRGWKNVEVLHADAGAWRCDEPADLVTFSYSLTMMPDWFKAVDRAWENLKPGGMFAIVDFYISRKYPEAGLRKHSKFQRFLWPKSYAWDDVFVSPDHVPYLRAKFEPVRFEERLGRVPYMLGLKSPYYLFLGRKRP